MPTLAAPLDFAKLEGRQIRIHVLSTAPSSPVTGQMYYNSTDNTLYWWDGTTWVAAKGGLPSGTAGGDLTGSYPNPQIAPGVVVDADVAAANKDGVAATPSLRTLGTGASQAAAGNDARFSDSRAPTGAAGGDLNGSTYPNPIVAALAITDAKVAAANKDGAVGTPSMRTLGAGAQQAMPGNRTLDAIAAPVASVSLNGQKITGLQTPTNIGEAANKDYVDSMAQGLDVKASCRVASTANINIASPGATIDGVTMAATNRVLLKDQTTPSQNGIYVWNGAAVAMTRTTDADTSADVTPGMFTFVEEGTVNADSGWVLTTNAPITLDTTGLAFAQFSGAGQVTAGAGLVKTGNVVDVIGTLGRILVGADAVDIDPAYVGQASIVTVGAITTGSWTAGVIGIPYGGTGANTAAGARTALGASGKYSSATHGAGTSIVITAATHGVGVTAGLIVQCYIEATGVQIWPDIVVAANRDVTITFAASQSANTIRTVIIG